MKKIYHQFAFTLLCLLSGPNILRAQLSGVVTIDSSQPTSGSVYSSFTALASVLNISGVNGPLTVNVTAGSGPYVEQVQFLQTPGISATNTITFNGNGCTLTFQSTAAAPWTLLLSGSDYMTFNNLKVTNTSTVNAVCFAAHLWNGADYNNFNNCTFSVSINNTSANTAAFSISGASTHPLVTTNSGGSNNVINTCTLSGGAIGANFESSPATPSTGNQLINSNVTEFYTYGFINGNSENTVVRGNVFERPNRLTLQAPQTIFITPGSVGGLYERNHIRNLTGSNPTSSVNQFGFYVTGSGTVGSPNIIRNNLISNLRGSGQMTGAYIVGINCSVFHNTFVFDDQTLTSNGTWGISSVTILNVNVQNNIIYISRPTSAHKTGITFSGTASGPFADRNVIYLTGSGSAYVGAWGNPLQNYTSLSAWQSATGYDLNSSTADPVFTNPTVGNFVPTSTVVNNMCLPLGVSNDFNQVTRSMVSPDPGAFEFFNSACSGTPPSNSVVSPTMSLCMGMSAALSFSTPGTYTNSGYAVQWYESTATALGPFTAAPSGTLFLYVPPVMQSSYYVAVVTCTNGSGTFTTAAVQVTIAGTTTNTVPYYEGFENLAANRLPNCSWSVSAPNGVTQTNTVSATFLRVPRTGTNFASFRNTPTGTNYFYSNGIQMNAGITYSAALWFIHETLNLNNWNGLSILIGTVQSAPAMSLVVSTNGTLTPALYTLLSNTLTVPQTGLYYIGVRATPSTNVAQYLSWDDLSVTIPCSLNSPTLSAVASSTSICSNESVTITTSGADAYLWANGPSTNSIQVAPQYPTSYNVVGTNTLSGCSSTLIQNINVRQAPVAFATVSDPQSCPGTPVILTAMGASQYSWNTGASTPTLVVTPSVTTVYSVTVTNSLQCSVAASVTVVVNPVPTVSASISSTQVCTGSSVTLNASGAQSYQWMSSSNGGFIGSPAVAYPTVSDTWTLVGTDANGCEDEAYVAFVAGSCTGEEELIGSPIGLQVYPNPVHDRLNVILSEAETIQAILTDVSGRVLLSETLNSQAANLELGDLANGVYYLSLSSSNRHAVVKVVKH